MQLSKYLAILLILWIGTAFGFNNANILLANLDTSKIYLVRGDYYKGAKTISDPCANMGASGTYDSWWNGEYSDDTDKICHDSGNSTADTTDATAGVIHANGAINGVIGALLDAPNEHIRWTSTSETIDSAGTIEFNVTLPATTNGNANLVEIYTDANNLILAYFANSDSKIHLRHEGGGSYDFENTDPLTDNTTYNVQLSWNTTTHRMGTNVDNAGWSCSDQASLDPFAGTVNHYAVGDDQAGVVSISDSWKVDDFQLREGYEGN